MKMESIVLFAGSYIVLFSCMKATNHISDQSIYHEVLQSFWEIY